MMDAAKAAGLLALSTLILTGCLSTADRKVNLHNDLVAVYGARSTAILDFFAEEAAEAGVSRIRRMTKGETPKRWSRRQSGCAQAQFERRLILIDPTRTRCLDLDHLAHEIAHIGVLRTHCYGHGDRFYAYNRRIAQRFEQAFPALSDRGGWEDPVGSVNRRAARYRVGAENCL